MKTGIPGQFAQTVSTSGLYRPAGESWFFMENHV